MKQIGFGILMAAVSVVAVHAQDIQRFAQRDLSGSARYVGMGGAMTAVGGDASAVTDNPAGLGVYRRQELAVTGDYMWDYTRPVGEQTSQKAPRGSLPEMSLVWSFKHTNREQGVLYNNLMVSAHRLKTFNRSISVQGAGTGLLETICKKTNGLEASAFDNGDIDQLWNNTELGWLSILGYENYLINPVDGDERKWEPATRFTEATLNIKESGYVEQYTLAWAMNISNQWYVGLGLNIPTMHYQKVTTLTESNNRQNTTLTSELYANGTGVSGSIGLLYRPCQWVRIGAAFQTPTLMDISLQSAGTMTAEMDSITSWDTPESASGYMRWTLPMRSSVGVAVQVKQYALLSLQWDYAHQFGKLEKTGVMDVHSLRAGAEAAVWKGLYFNAGYVYESTFREGLVAELGYNSVRTDTDYRLTPSSQNATFGVGYRGNWFLFNLAYQYGWQRIRQYATEMQTEPFDIATRTHRVVCTVAWRFN